jgi:probable HAF family extracellular repeat protein
MAGRTDVALRRPAAAMLLSYALVTACNGGSSTGPPPNDPSEPSVASTVPASASPSVTLDVRVLGSGFDAGSSVGFALDGVVDPRVRTNQTTYGSENELLANITIAADALPGLYDVSVTSSAGKKGTGGDLFMVLAPVELTVTAADPAAVPQNITLDVRVLGSGFDRGSKVELVLNGVADPKVKTNGTTYGSGTELVANVTVAADALPERYDVRVTSSTGGTVSGVDLLTVLAIQSLAPDAFGMDVNSSGTVAGYVEVPPTCFGVGFRPVVWTSGHGLRRLPVPPGTCSAASGGINDEGVVIGSVNNTAYRWLPGPGETWTPEALGLEGSPQDINRRGDIALLYVADAAAVVWNATVWTPEDGILHLADLPGSTRGCLSMGLNNLRHVVGRCHYAENDKLTPVIWSAFASQPIQLPQLPGVERSSPNAINDAGVIVGLAMPTGGASHAVRWVPSGSTWVIEDLGTLGGDSEARSINNLGQIIGISRVGETEHAFVWEQGSGMRPLAALGAQGSVAFGLNDPKTGEPTLVAGFSDVGGRHHMVRWSVE